MPIPPEVGLAVADAAAVVALTWLPLTVLSRSIIAAPHSTPMPPENALASPCRLVADAWLPLTAVPLIAAEPLWTRMPPSPACPQFAEITELDSSTALFVTAPPDSVSLTNDSMPPPTAFPLQAFGPVVAPRLPVTVLLVSDAVSQLSTPAPSAWLASLPPTWLSLTVVFESDKVPQLSIPPPPAHANPFEAAAGSAAFAVMTLLVMVTVAPPLKWALGGISTPPPNAESWQWPTDSGVERVTPPVMVTASIETIGSVVAPKDPIVITGPPPLMAVETAPAPTIFTLTPIVKPPRYVPAATWIVSPLWAAAIASDICE